MSEERLSVSIRMTRELTRRLKQAANDNSHSMNAEIVRRLNWTLDAEDRRRQIIDEAKATGNYDFLYVDTEQIKAKEEVMKYVRQAMRLLNNSDIVNLVLERLKGEILD